MKLTHFLVFVALSVASPSLLAQGRGMGGGFPQADSLAINPVARGERSGALITGSPVSARQVSRTVQTLSDGTLLDNSQTTLFYRDSQGRTRTEPLGSPDAPVLILDPVAGLRITLHPSAKSALRMAAQAIELALVDQVRSQAVAIASRAGTPAKSPSTFEDLGFQNQSGVLAQGTRTTIVIPQGQIGNNREIRVVNERWYSKDLQMVVKSTNSDPRFGVTTYELTNVTFSADPSLFQIPPGYSIEEAPYRNRVAN